MGKIDQVMTAALGPSWRTSVFGLGSILGVLADLLISWANQTMPDLKADAAALWAGFGLLFTKDRVVSNAGNPVPARKVDPLPPIAEHE